MEKKEYEVYGLAVVKSDIDGPLREVILRAHALKSRDPAAAWAKFRRDPDFQTFLREIHHHPHLTGAMRGAALALITSRRRPVPRHVDFFMPSTSSRR
jgi:hypothetical protein